MAVSATRSKTGHYQLVRETGTVIELSEIEVAALVSLAGAASGVDKMVADHLKMHNSLPLFERGS